jgi:Metallopeptidase family M24
VRVEFVDAADIVIRLRMVKSEEELRYMRKAAEVTGLARQRLFDRHIVSDMTERDVARAMRRLILEEGGDRTSFVHLQLDLPGCKNQFHYERPLRKGTVLAVDTGAYVWMYIQPWRPDGQRSARRRRQRSAPPGRRGDRRPCRARSH